MLFQQCMATLFQVEYKLMIHIHVADYIFKYANDMYQNVLIGVHIIKIRYADIS